MPIDQESAVSCDATRDRGARDSNAPEREDELEAVDFTLGLARRDDAVVVFADGVTKGWKRVIYSSREAPPGDVEGSA